MENVNQEFCDGCLAILPVKVLVEGLCPECRGEEE